MQTHGRVRKGRFSLRHSPNAKGTFCGRPLSPTGLTEIEVGEFDCKTLVLDATAPITLTELSFFGEGDGGIEAVGAKVTTCDFKFRPERPCIRTGGHNSQHSCGELWYNIGRPWVVCLRATKRGGK